MRGQAMPKTKLALIGRNNFTRTALFGILSESDFEVDVLDTDAVEFSHPDRFADYAVVIVEMELGKGKEEEFFAFLLSLKGFLLVNPECSIADISIGTPRYIDRFTTPEEIITKINDIIFSKSNQRHAPRVGVNIDVEYEFQGNRYKSRIQNLSRNGAFIGTLNPPDKNSLIKISFALPECKIETEGRVVYRIGYNLEKGIISHPGSTDKKITAMPGMGIVFETMPEQTRIVIQTFLERHGT